MYGGDLRPIALQPAPATLGTLEQLLAIEQIKRTKALYCFSLDTQDWDLYQSLFTADAVLDVPETGQAPIAGAEAIRRFVAAVVAGVTTTHHCHTPIIDFTAPDAASVVWAMEDMLRFPPGAATHTLHGMGHYFERYRFGAGVWRIASCRLERLRVDVQ